MRAFASSYLEESFVSGELDLTSIDVIGVAECALDVRAPSAHDWPCPACGLHRPVDRAWALKIRNRTGAPMQRAIVVCDDCFAALGEVVAKQFSDEPVTISPDDDPIELLRTALDTDDVQVAFHP